jgi:hypothetical protein
MTAPKTFAKPVAVEEQEPAPTEEDPMAPVASKPVEGETVTVVTVHPYPVFCHRQNRLIPALTPTAVVNDVWVQAQISGGGLRIL